ncbi:MAG: hypothetical protein ACRDIB_02060 [Ardenticatenaceae bacterium]
MSILYIEPVQEARETLFLIQSAIESEIAKLQLALQAAQKRLEPFERRYGVTSDYFNANMAAEDLEGGDEEYVHWAGEYKLMQSLQQRLQQLREIEYSDSKLFRAD